MSAFIVTVRKLGQEPDTYFAIGTDSGAVHIDAQDRHGPCGVTVLPA